MNSMMTGKTEQVAIQAANGLAKGMAIHQISMIGQGGNTLAARTLATWRQANPDGVSIVVSPNAQCAFQWKRHGIEAISRRSALIEANRSGTIQGHALADVHMVVFEESQYRPEVVQKMRELLPEAAFLMMHCGNSQADQSILSRLAS